MSAISFMGLAEALHGGIWFEQPWDQRHALIVQHAWMFATLAPWSIFFGIHTGWSRARKDARKHILAESEFIVKEAYRWVEPEAEGRLNGLEKEIWGQVRRRLFKQETKALEEHGAFQGMLTAQKTAPKASCFRL